MNTATHIDTNVDLKVGTSTGNNADTERWIAEWRASGTLAGLPRHHHVDGAWMASRGGATMPLFDPGSARVFASVASGDASDAAQAVGAAHAALRGPWSALAPAERGRLLSLIAQRLRRDAERFAVVETLDAGKRLSESRDDLHGAARTFEYYAGACDKLHGQTMPLGPAHLGYTLNEPVGVTVHIVPWNYPLSTLARGVAPALAAGCSVVAKPAEQTPLTALMLAALASEAGLPPGVFNVVTGTGAAVGRALVADPRVDHISFTGSVAAGVDVMQTAAPHVARVLLELGGKSPAVVLADADVDAAVADVLGAIYENAGQICSAASRVVVARRLHAEFVDKLAAGAKARRPGHGLRDAPLGAVNSAAHLERIAGFVDRARARGVAVRAGGQRACDPESGAGWFYEATLLDDVPRDDECVREEIFGPVLTVQVFDDVDEAVALANGTDYALVAGVYTRELASAHRLARQIDAGQVFINQWFAGGVAMPFGGNRRSGFGREKGLEGMRSYCKLKSVVARL